MRRPWRYATSFFGVIDLLAILPTYLSLLLVGSNYLAVVRVLRLLRIFRVLKLAEYSSEAGVLIESLLRSRRKILVFLSTLLTIVVIFARADVPGRGTRARLHQHPGGDVLGDRDHVDGGLRRHHARNAAGPLHHLGADPDRLQHHRGTDRHLHRGTGQVAAPQAARLAAGIAA